MGEKLLFEIGTEEIPAGYIPPALAQIGNLAKIFFAENRIDIGKILTFGTPRRLTLLIEEVAEKQSDLVQNIQGPPKSAAFKPDGTPTPAATGFAKGKGVAVEDLFFEETPKGEYVFAKVEEMGKPTLEILPQILKQILSSISFPKIMRWDDSEITFARPIRWLLALLEDTLINFEYGNLKTDKITFGHRFTHPDPQKVKDCNDYFSILENSNIILDPEKRKAEISNQLEKVAKEHGGQVLHDEELLEAVNYLVEYPTTIYGKFSEDFLELPDKVLIRAMAEHQKYFSVTDENGDLMPIFLNVLGNAPENTEEIQTSNERVLLARLDDAKFFFEEDTKTPLIDKVDILKNVVYQESLGTLFEKTERIQKLAYFMGERLGFSTKQSMDSQRAALLSKADLVTNMINEKEFAKLQGYMGMEYAKASGENDEVARGIYEHYLPRFADDKLPQTTLGAVVSIADKMDSIVGCFGVGLIPTGSQDPYALRRQAIGIIRILLDKNMKLSLSDLVEHSMCLLGMKIKEEQGILQKQVLAFFYDRISKIFIDRGFKYDTVEAVLGASFDNVPDVEKRVQAVSQFRDNKQFEALATGFKRVVNILSKKEIAGEPNIDLLIEPDEKVLYETLKETELNIEEYLAQKDYVNVMKHLVEMRSAIDNFFDNVMVMVEDEKLRNNRLDVLYKIRDLFFQVADFSKILVEGQ